MWCRTGESVASMGLFTPPMHTAASTRASRQGAADGIAAHAVAEQDEAAAAEAAVFLQKAQRGAQVVRCLRKAPARPGPVLP